MQPWIDRRISSLFLWMLDRKLTKASFPEQGGEPAAVRTRQIAASFQEGARAGLTGQSWEVLQEIERSVPWFRRPFFWEGYAFGRAALCSARLRPRHPERSGIVTGYRAMHYTGYGFWSGLAAKYHLPQLSFAAESWDGVADSARFWPLLIGGFAFATVGQVRRLTPALLARLESGPRAGWPIAARHGCGRALWFLFMDRPKRLCEVLTAYPDAERELVEGIGVAITYTNLQDPARILALIDGFDERHRTALLLGAGICFGAAAEDDPRLEPRLTELTEPRLAAARELCRRASSEAEPGFDWYFEALRRARALLG